MTTVFRTKSIFLIILSCMLLISGCAQGKLGTANPGPASGKTAVEQSTQIQTTVAQSNAVSQESSANTTSANTAGTPTTSEATTNETTTGAAVNESPAIKVKALYLTGWTVGSMAKVNHFIDLAKTTEINSYVVDIKDDDGYVGYESQIPEVMQNGTWKKKYDVDKVIKAFHDGGVHIIGRIVCFKDPVYSVKRPDLAIKSTTGGVWKDNGGISWLNPYNKDNWAYLVSIAKEAVTKGFDEIQFDYVRFPSDKRKYQDYSGITTEKYKAISDFLAYAKTQLPGTKVSADIFGITLESPADTENIGQYLEYVGKDIDYISPMVYPSHYAYGQIVNKVKFAAPDLQPYGVVYNTLVKAKDRISKVSGYNAQVRPYLQDFTASWLRPKSMYQTYGVQQVKEQIKAVYDAGYDQWILWDAGNKYHEDALVKETK